MLNSIILFYRFLEHPFTLAHAFINVEPFGVFGVFNLHFGLFFGVVKPPVDGAGKVFGSVWNKK